jgi:crotonobetainyl-CoA:carnitine CoA-transferase CaiB-like acyl-CoA transferase
MLEGLRVIELTHLIAGPFGGQLFADNGATVIKVESPEGEISRHRDPIAVRERGTVTAHFASMNRGKQSVTVDLKNPAGRDFFLSLVDSADVVLSNMRPGALERLGIALPDLVAARPSLIAISITGFGVNDTIDGERDRAGLAVVAEAIAGLTNLTKDRQHNPVWVGFALGDMIAGITAYSSALAAVIERSKTGLGRFIDLALVETILPLTSIAMAREQLADAELTASAAGNDFHGVPYGVYEASDGYVSIGANTNRFWQGVCTAMGRPELATDPRFATFEGRSAHFYEVTEIVESWTASLERDEIVRRLTAEDIPVAAVADMREVRASRRYAARGMLMDVDDGVGGTLVLPADPALRGDTPSRPVPRLGEHTIAVAEDILGSADRAAELAATGAFGEQHQPSSPVGSPAHEGSKR